MVLTKKSIVISFFMSDLLPPSGHKREINNHKTISMHHNKCTVTHEKSRSSEEKKTNEMVIKH